MNLILLGAIQLYWRLIPGHKRRNCLFRESCSHYVYRITKEKGFFGGCSALYDRIRKCRPGYRLSKNGDTFQLRLKDGTLLSEEEISLSLLPYTSETAVELLNKKRTGVRKLKKRYSNA